MAFVYSGTREARTNPRGVVWSSTARGRPVDVSRIGLFSFVPTTTLSDGLAPAEKPDSHEGEAVGRTTLLDESMYRNGWKEVSNGALFVGAGYSDGKSVLTVRLLRDGPPQDYRISVDDHEVFSGTMSYSADARVDVVNIDLGEGDKFPIHVTVEVERLKPSEGNPSGKSAQPEPLQSNAVEIQGSIGRGSVGKMTFSDNSIAQVIAFEGENTGWLSVYSRETEFQRNDANVFVNGQLVYAGTLISSGCNHVFLSGLEGDTVRVIVSYVDGPTETFVLKRE